MKTKRGFTLIEIVIIIMVLGILTAVTIPLVSKAINNAQIKNDKILVDNINAILSEDKIHGRPKDVNEVLWLLSTSELDIDEPNYKYHTFYWLPDDNVVVIYESETNKVVYPKEFTYVDTIGLNWEYITGRELGEIADLGYKITYIINGKQVRFKGATTYSGENDFTLPIPSLENYTFSGWKNNQKLEGDSITIIPKGSTNNKTFYASFTKNTEDIVNMKYSITYILDGGRIENPILSYITPLNEDITLPKPTKAEYEFLGWYTTSNFEGEKIEKITAGSIGNKVFYAKWEKNEAVQSYNIIYHLNGGTLINPPLKYDGTIAIELPIPSKENYEFEGWYETPEFTNEKIESIPVGSTEDKTFYAKWKEIPPREEGVLYIFYELYGGAQTNAPTKFDNSKDVYLFTPLKRGYDFEGWYLDPEFGKVDNEPITVIETEKYSSDITLYAKWVPIQYEIVYELNNGNWSSEALEIKTTYTIEEEIDLPTPVRNGYLFGAWYKEADFSGQPVSKISVGSTGTQTLYVNWYPIPYYVDCYLEKGSTEIYRKVEYNVETLTELPIPEKEGYKFLGWYEGETTLDDPVTNIMPGTTGDKKLYAMWVEEGYYQIDYIGNGGILEDGISTSWQKLIDISAEPLTLDIPVHASKKFLGWYDNPEFNGDSIENIEITETGYIKLYAKWEENPAT